MSKYGWESGTVTLPTAAVSGVRKAVCDAANRLHAEVLAECLRLWEGPIAKTNSVELYFERLESAADAPRGRTVGQAVSDAANGVMTGIVGWSGGRAAQRTPRAPRASDVEAYAPSANTRTTSFGGRSDEWHIRGDGAKLHYNSGDNNHQVEHAREHPVVAAMMRELGRLDWTRATGGMFTGNDEYNQESRDSGGGGNYITAAYGPLGEAEQAGMSVEKYRKIMGSRTSAARRW